MENISLVINDVIKISSDLYRVIKTAEASVWAVMLNTSKLNIVSLSYDTLNNLQDNNTFELVAPGTPSSICFDKLTATVKESPCSRIR